MVGLQLGCYATRKAFEVSKDFVTKFVKYDIKWYYFLMKLM